MGHPHDWGMLGWNPQYDPYKYQYTLALDKDRSPTLTNAYGTPDIWQPFQGVPAAQPLHWLPTLSMGSYTGQYQAAWSVATNGDYTVLGGEFPGRTASANKVSSASPNGRSRPSSTRSKAQPNSLRQ